MRHLAFALLMLALQIVPVSAQDQWREFTSQADGFSILLPQEPVRSSAPIGNTKATQTNFLVDLGARAYLISVIQLEKGSGPKNPDQAYFQNLLKNYARGSKSAVRTSKPATIAGKPGIDGTADDGSLAHLVQILTSGDRIYMVVYAAPKGQENSADAMRFRASFKLKD